MSSSNNRLRRPIIFHRQTKALVGKIGLHRRDGKVVIFRQGDSFQYFNTKTGRVR